MEKFINCGDSLLNPQMIFYRSGFPTDADLWHSLFQLFDSVSSLPPTGYPRRWSRHCSLARRGTTFATLASAAGPVFALSLSGMREVEKLASPNDPDRASRKADGSRKKARSPNF
jgi:hypothetical protein